MTKHIRVWKNHPPEQTAGGRSATLRAFWRRRGSLPAACYLLALAVWLVLGAVHLGSDVSARATRKLLTEELPVESFQLVDLAPAETDAYTTTSGDPQMILEEVGGRVIRTISYRASYQNADPREICLYYTTRQGEDYSADRRVFPTVTAAGEYLFTLPRTRLSALRLDICSPDPDKAVTVVFDPATITLNDTATLPGVFDYFIPTWYQAFCLILYPALAAAALNWLAAVLRYARSKLRPAPGHTQA